MIEQLIKVSPPNKYIKTFSLTYILLSITLIFFFKTQAFLILTCSLCIFIILFYFKNRYIEFEYSIVYDELRIDKIINKQKRKRILTLEFGSIKSVGVFKNNFYGKKKIINACVNKKNSDTYFIEFFDKNHSDFILLITPNDSVKRALNMV